MYIGNKLPVIITITHNQTNSTVKVDIFSNIEKAEAHFLIMCAESKISFVGGENVDWKINRNGKTISIEWKEIK